MLKSQNRLKKGNDFTKVFKQSRPIYYSNLVLRFTPSRFSDSRFGFVISNKIEKRAVRRNCLKRQLRALSRELLPKLGSNLDLVLTVKVPFVYPFDKAEVRRQFIGIMRKTGLIR